MTVPDDISTCILIARLANPQDSGAWSVFASRFRPLIRTWCRQWAFTLEDQDEFVQSVEAKLVKEMQQTSYDLKRDFRPWLKTVVRNTVWSALRHLRANPGARGAGGNLSQEALEQVRSPESIERLTQELESSFVSDKTFVWQAISCVQQRVEPKTWEAFWKTAYEGRSCREVAQDLGEDMTVAAVGQAKRRVCQMLRNEIARLQQSEARDV